MCEEDSSTPLNLSTIATRINNTNKWQVEACKSTQYDMRTRRSYQPQLVITEQPQASNHRFRYECKQRNQTKRNSSSILGVCSIENHPTYPTVEIRGHTGPARVHVFCVTASDPQKLHPHKLVGRTDCNLKTGVCVVNINPGTPARYVFDKLTIQCVKKNDFKSELSNKPAKLVKIFKGNVIPTVNMQKNVLGKNPIIVACSILGPVSDLSMIDIKAVRLCYVAFLPNERGRFVHQLPPVVSNVIYDRKAKPKLILKELSDCTAPANGGKKMILLCEKVNESDIKVRFFQVNNNGLRWDAYGTVGPHNVHKHVAITIRTPAYYDQLITEQQQVKIQLFRPSDQAVSEPIDFLIVPSIEIEALPHIRSENEPDGDNEPLPPFVEIMNALDFHHL